jgi:tRNA U34 5-methylaminomethyl-2-thiouridine-forming methyltransferase MnmC
MSSTRLIAPAYLLPRIDFDVRYSDVVDEIERQVTADGSATLFSSRFGQTFHSRHGALAESRHVFLAGSGVGRRLGAGLPARVLEVGFGTGLNFLVTAQAAQAAGAHIDYVALERDLLPEQVLAGLGYERYAPDVLDRLLAFRRGLATRPRPGGYRGEGPGFTLELRLGDAAGAYVEEAAFDAVYHDAFSPDANPELWSAEFLARLARSLDTGGILATYTVKGDVRRRLVEAGLRVTKAPGPPAGKREMLVAARPDG